MLYGEAVGGHTGPRRPAGAGALFPLRVAKNTARLLRSALMADFLTAYSLTQPDKLAMVDDRPDGTVHHADLQRAERAGRTSSPTCCSTWACARATRRWCGAGRTRIGLVLMINAARKLGVTAVPLNYRLSDEEAAYVTDHCDATIVYVDAEFAPMFERIRGELPKVRALPRVRRRTVHVPDGMTDIDALIDAASHRRAGDPRGHRGRRHDDLHQRHHRQAEGRAAPRQLGRRRRPAR